MTKGNLILKLTSESKAKLLEECRAIYGNIFSDHVTMQYNVDLDRFKAIEGQRAEIIVGENCWNDIIQAVKVNVDSILPMMNKIPHITISAKKGISPVKSNNMFIENHQTKLLENNLVLEGNVYFEKYNGE